MASPRSLNVNFTNKQPSFIEVQIANFQRLPGFESDNTAVGHFIAVGIDNVAMARAAFTGDGTYQLAVNWATYSNSDITNFYIDTTGRETISVVDGFGQYPEKVKFDIVSLIVDGVLPELTIWHESNWTSPHRPEYGGWTSETVYEVYNYGAGAIWHVTGTWAQGLRPKKIIIEFDRQGANNEIEIKVYQTVYDGVVGSNIVGMGYNWGEQFTEILLDESNPWNGKTPTDDIAAIRTFLNYGVPESHSIVGMRFVY